MATLSERLRENVPGPFYVTSECIDCDLCREAAPDIYRRNDDIGYSVVHHQPATPEEEALAIDGMDACPVEAIGRELGLEMDEGGGGAGGTDQRGGVEAGAVAGS